MIGDRFRQHAAVVTGVIEHSGGNGVNKVRGVFIDDVQSTVAAYGARQHPAQFVA